MKERRIVRYKNAVIKIAENRWGGMEWLIVMKGFPRIHDPTDCAKSVGKMKWWLTYAKDDVDQLENWYKEKKDPKNWKNRFKYYKTEKIIRKPTFNKNYWSPHRQLAVIHGNGIVKEF